MISSNADFEPSKTTLDGSSDSEPSNRLNRSSKTVQQTVRRRFVDVAPLPGGNLTLRPYQLDALTSCEEARRGGVLRQLVALPTGTGKTLVFCELIRRRGGRALVLVHRDELMSQTIDKLAMVAPGLHVGVVKGETDETHASVIVASVQTLSRPARLQRLAPDFQTVIVDEAHHLAAPSYQRILEHLGVGREGGPLTVGVTATPERGDGQPLAGWAVVYRRELLEMIRAGFLSDIRALQVHLEADFSKLHTRAGDFIDREAEEMLLGADAPKHTVQAYLEHAAGRKALVFTPTVRVAREMAEAFARENIAAASIDGEMPLDERRKILAAYRRGDVRVISNCAVLTEGFDEPTIDCIFIARPTRSRSLYIQCIGRGTRPYPGKSDLLLIDLIGATTRHDLMTAPGVLGLPARQLAERGVVATVEAQDVEQARIEQHGRLVAQTVELFKRRPLHWISSGAGCFVLSLGVEGTLMLSQDGERWRVVLRSRADVCELATDLPLDYAQGTAEDYARKVGAAALVDPQATWRLSPPTDRQLAALRRCRIPAQPGLSRGEASDLLLASFASRSHNTPRR
jgi:ATP-dependent helicase IRC3